MRMPVHTLIFLLQEYGEVCQKGGKTTGEIMSSIAMEQSKLGHLVRTTLGPLLLILLCPPTVMIVWYINVFLGGSLEKFYELSLKEGFFTTVYTLWKPYFFGSSLAWKMIAVFGGVQLALMKFVPGKEFLGPVTPKGNVPLYKANGVACFLITVFLFLFSSFYLKLFSAAIIYDNFGALLGALNVFSLLFCLMLYLKGRFAPSTTDTGISGNPLFDYYWGTELYPQVLGWNLKMFTNCRFGMMGWGIIILSFGAKQAETYGLSNSMLIAIALQLIYIFKFFCWETGYLRSLDIMHDRAGYYICWGCLVWVPCVYTSPILYLVNHPHKLSLGVALTIFCLGVGMVLINYLADRQRQMMRATQGKAKVWGKKPVLIKAKYVTQDGEKRENLLLASGWWGIARHFHYVPEILGALFWTLPVLFDNALPYFYVVFLTILLIDRTVRDDKRCKEKYGKGWDSYTKAVKYKMIPYIF